jgi:2-C-methyl-D-erythritol 2,4-cyclodiphosphate synthase
MKIGFGFDSHKLVVGRKLILGGVTIPYSIGLFGHSDADVLVHAVIDSLFGAAGLPDIGNNFPDSDEKYKNTSSLILLTQTGEILTQNGLKVVNIDSTVVIEKPKLSPYVQDMRKNIADSLKIDVSQVGVKAKTNEGLSFSGQESGVPAFAVSLIDSIK